MQPKDLITQVRQTLPDHLHDAYWQPCVLIFMAVPVLAESMTEYFDFEREEICINRFKRDIYPYLSSGQQFLVDLAFHCYNPLSNPLPDDGLLNLRLLDSYHYNIAVTAIHLAANRQIN